MSEQEGAQPGARLAEVVAALSVATDMGTGKQPGRALRMTVVGLRIAELMDLPPAERSLVYWTIPLVMLGCTAESSAAAAIFGDELAFGAAFAPLVTAPRGEMTGWLLRNYAADEHFARRLRRLAQMVTAGRRLFEISNAAHCEVAQRLTRRLGIDDAVLEPLGAVFERWDGNGGPRGLRGDQVPLAVRIGHVDVAVQNASAVDEVLHLASPWDAFLAAEPDAPRHATIDRDAAASVIADFVDLKSDWLAGHSRGVAAGARRRRGARGDAPRALRRQRVPPWRHRRAAPAGGTSSGRRRQFRRADRAAPIPTGAYRTRGRAGARRGDACRTARRRGGHRGRRSCG